MTSRHNRSFTGSRLLDLSAIWKLLNPGMQNHQDSGYPGHQDAVRGSLTLYRWKRQLVRRGGSTAVGLEARVRELEAELRRVERERDILKKALSIFGRDG